MAQARPFAYNPSLEPIPGTTQIGDLIYGAPISGFTNSPQFWNGPDEEIRYVIAYQNSTGDQPAPVGLGAFVQFWGCPKTDSDFINLSEFVSRKNGTPQTFSTATDAKIWLNSNGYFTSYDENVSPTPTPTITQTPTPTETSILTTPTPTPTETSILTTPTPTPTPSSTALPVTGYSFNLVETPYNFPSSGNSIMNNTGGLNTGSTEINVLATGGRGFYFNSFDTDGIDRTNYYSAFTGESVTITLSQSGNTAIYSGDTDSFKYWQSSPTENGFVFGAGIGTPPSGAPSGTAILIQSATTNYTIGIPVYVSLVVN